MLPVANLAQSTEQLRTDSLTLFVCLDEMQQATGTLYKDAGDGFAYRRGDYSLTRFDARLEKKLLTASLARIEGDYQGCDTPCLRIAYTDRRGRTVFSPWQQGTKTTLRLKQL